VPTVSGSAEIPVKPAELWERMAGDLSNIGDWNVTHSAWPDPLPDSYEVGTKFREQVKIMGMPGEVTWEVKELEVGKNFALEGDGPMGIKLRSAVELEETGDGTKATMESSFEGGPLAGPMGETVAKAAEKAAEESLAKLRSLIAPEGAGQSEEAPAG
jgi:Polyketide cyclase / dehydrase and lipid transport